MLRRALVFLLHVQACAGAALPESLSAGRTAVITGAAAGLGRAAALKCAGLGMRVCLVDCDEARLAATAKMVSAAAAGGDEDVMSVALDVASRSAVFGLAQEVFGRFGEVGFLLSNAGAGTGSPSALRDFEAWERSLDVNLCSTLHVLQAFVPTMLEQRSVCTVVCTGSKQGITAPPGNLAYNVAKSGVKIIAEGLQHELRGDEKNEGRVQAHLFVPGFVNTNLAFNYFKELKGAAFDPETDVPWSEEKPAAGGWMPGRTIDYLFDAIGEGKFYIICPDNDVTSETDAKRIAWAAGDMIVRDAPLSRWDPRFKQAFADYMASGTPSDALKQPASAEQAAPSKFCLNVKLCIKPERRDEFLTCIRNNQAGTLSSEPLAIEYVWGEDADTPNTFHFYEKYAGRAGFEAHQATEHFAAWEEFAGSGPFTAPPVVQFYEEMGAV